MPEFRVLLKTSPGLLGSVAPDSSVRLFIVCVSTIFALIPWRRGPEPPGGLAARRRGRNRRGGRGVERFDARRHGDAPAGALAKRRRQAWPLDAGDESEPLGPGCRAELGAVGRQRDQGRMPSASSSLDRADPAARGPGTRPGRRPGCSGDETGARPRGAAPPARRRMPRPSGSPRRRSPGPETGRTACSPRARDPRPTRRAASGTWTSKSGACVPALSSWRNRSSVKRYQSRSARGGGGPCGSGQPGFDLAGRPAPAPRPPAADPPGSPGRACGSPGRRAGRGRA